MRLLVAGCQERTQGRLENCNWLLVLHPRHCWLPASRSLALLGCSVFACIYGGCVSLHAASTLPCLSLTRQCLSNPTKQVAYKLRLLI
jgi:hypothetical protein